MADSRFAPVRFVILAQARTGSNLLCGLLNSHPEVLCHHGLFNSEGIHYALDHRDGSFDFGSMTDRDRDPAGFLDRVWSTDLSCRAVGFKINRAEHAAASALVMSDAGVRKVLLRRRNRIKTYVSALIAERSRTWESYGSTAFHPPTERVSVDATALKEYAAMVAEYYSSVEQALSASGQDYFCIDYECLSSPAEIGRLLKFLDVSCAGPGLSRIALTAPGFKRNPADLRDIVTNFDQLSAELRGSGLEIDLSYRDLPALSVVHAEQVSGDSMNAA